jgi:hypothetical protein
MVSGGDLFSLLISKESMGETMHGTQSILGLRRNVGQPLTLIPLFFVFQACSFRHESRSTIFHDRYCLQGVAKRGRT